MTETAAGAIARLGLVLPDAAPPPHPFEPYSLWNGLLTVSGQIPMENGTVSHIGTVGLDVDLAAAQDAARLCALHVVAQIDAACEGDLERVERVLRISGYVACTPGFTQQSQVVNAASELVRAIFGKRGGHARTAIGVAALPLGVCVEIDSVVALRR